MSNPFAAEIVLVGGAAFMSGAADPNAANAGAGTALPTGATTGVFIVTAGAERGSMWINLDGTATGWLNTRASGDSAIFGDGSNGALNVAGTTTEASASDVFYTDGTIG